MSGGDAVVLHKMRSAASLATNAKGRSRQPRSGDALLMSSCHVLDCYSMIVVSATGANCTGGLGHFRWQNRGLRPWTLN